MRGENHRPVCLFRITARDREKLEALVFKRYPNREWGSFFRFGYRITRWGIHVSFVDALEPLPGELKRDSGIVEFEASYILRAQLALAEIRLGIGVIHSHPQGCSTFASSLEEDMDCYFSREFAAYGEGLPYVSLRLFEGEDGHPRIAGPRVGLLLGDGTEADFAKTRRISFFLRAWFFRFDGHSVPFWLGVDGEPVA